jgi:phage head maturation protease
MAHLQAGNLDGSSFSFMVDDATWWEQGELLIREIRAVRLFDVGPVCFPAYPSTTAGVRSKASPQDPILPSIAARLTQVAARARQVEMLKQM